MSTKKIPTVVNNEKAEGVSETPNIERQYADLVKKFVPMSYKEIGEEIRRLFPSFNPVQGFEHKIYNEVDEPFDRYEIDLSYKEHFDGTIWLWLSFEYRENSFKHLTISNNQII